MRKGAVWEGKGEGKSTDVKDITHFFTVNDGLTGWCFLLHRFQRT
jgi:hypothetical protein